MSVRAKTTVLKRGLLIIVPILLLGGYISWAFSRPLPTLYPTNDLATLKAITPTPPISWSGYGEQAIGIVGSGVLATAGDQKPLPTASVAKTMVALAVLQKKPLALGQQGPNIPISAADVALYQQDAAEDQSVIPVAVGEKLTEYQALQALFLSSANNIATTITNWAFGSQAAYLAYANSYATTLGMTQTTFSDASGFSPQTTSTPADLVLLGETAVKHPVIAEVANQYTATLPIVGAVQNYNINVQPGSNTGITGLKTGNTDQGGGSFLYASPYDKDTTIVGIILDAPNLGTALHDAPIVASSIRANLHTDEVVTAGQKVAHYTVPWGGTINAVAQNTLSVVDWKGTQIPVIPKSVAISPRSAKGKVVGTTTFSYNSATHATNLVLDQAVPGPSLWWRLLHP